MLDAEPYAITITLIRIRAFCRMAERRRPPLFRQPARAALPAYRAGPAGQPASMMGELAPSTAIILRQPADARGRRRLSASRRYDAAFESLWRPSCAPPLKEDYYFRNIQAVFHNIETYAMPAARRPPFRRSSPCHQHRPLSGKRSRYLTLPLLPRCRLLRCHFRRRKAIFSLLVFLAAFSTLIAFMILRPRRRRRWRRHAAAMRRLLAMSDAKCVKNTGTKSGAYQHAGLR